MLGLHGWVRYYPRILQLVTIFRQKILWTDAEVIRAYDNMCRLPPDLFISAMRQLSKIMQLLATETMHIESIDANYYAPIEAFQRIMVTLGQYLLARSRDNSKT